MVKTPEEIREYKRLYAQEWRKKNPEYKNIPFKVYFGVDRKGF